METYWVPGVNNLGTYGRWAFQELTELYEIEREFEKRVAEAVEGMIAKVAGAGREVAADTVRPNGSHGR